MVASTYNEAIRRVLKHEGGYTNHPADPGGPTNFGITIHDYRKYVKPDGTAADVKAMRVETAKEIYRTKYWRTVYGDERAAGIDYSLFDYGVNSGVSRANKVLRRVLGLPDNASETDVKRELSKRSPAAVVKAINDERMRFLMSLKTWPTFGAGWGRRVSEVRAYSVALAGQAQTAPDPSPAPGRAQVPTPDVKKPTAGGGAVVNGGGALGFSDWIMAHPFEAVLIAGLIFGGIYLIVRKAARVWRDAKQDAPMPDTPVVPVT